MVARPFGRAVVVARAGHHFHRQFRHRLGFVSLFVKPILIVPFMGKLI